MKDLVRMKRKQPITWLVSEYAEAILGVGIVAAIISILRPENSEVFSAVLWMCGLLIGYGGLVRVKEVEHDIHDVEDELHGVRDKVEGHITEVTPVVERRVKSGNKILVFCIGILLLYIIFSNTMPPKIILEHNDNQTSIETTSTSK